MPSVSCDLTRLKQNKELDEINEGMIATENESEAGMRSGFVKISSEGLTEVVVSDPLEEKERVDHVAISRPSSSLKNGAEKPAEAMDTASFYKFLLVDELSRRLEETEQELATVSRQLQEERDSLNKAAHFDLRKKLDDLFADEMLDDNVIFSAAVTAVSNPLFEHIKNVIDVEGTKISITIDVVDVIKFVDGIKVVDKEVQVTLYDNSAKKFPPSFFEVDGFPKDSVDYYKDVLKEGVLHQINSTKDKHSMLGGHGAGLAICAMFLKKHGGKLTLNNQLGNKIVLSSPLNNTGKTLEGSFLRVKNSIRMLEDEKEKDNDVASPSKPALPFKVEASRISSFTPLPLVRLHSERIDRILAEKGIVPDASASSSSNSSNSPDTPYENNNQLAAPQGRRSSSSAHLFQRLARRSSRDSVMSPDSVLSLGSISSRDSVLSLDSVASRPRRRSSGLFSPPSLVAPESPVQADSPVAPFRPGFSIVVES